MAGVVAVGFIRRKDGCQTIKSAVRFDSRELMAMN